jgi:hypothetical protein
MPTPLVSVLRAALGETLEVPSGKTRPRTARASSIQRRPAGELVELLEAPAARCPHCDKPLPRPATRRRRLVQVVAGGRVLSTEVEA